MPGSAAPSQAPNRRYWDHQSEVDGPAGTSAPQHTLVTEDVVQHPAAVGPADSGLANLPPGTVLTVPVDSNGSIPASVLPPAAVGKSGIPVVPANTDTPGVLAVGNVAPAPAQATTAGPAALANTHANLPSAMKPIYETNHKKSTPPSTATQNVPPEVTEGDPGVASTPGTVTPGVVDVVAVPNKNGKGVHFERMLPLKAVNQPAGKASA
jgi:hypothetical protein